MALGPIQHRVEVAALSFLTIVQHDLSLRVSPVKGDQSSLSVAHRKPPQIVKAVLDVILDPAFFRRPWPSGSTPVVVGVKVECLPHQVDAMKLVEGLHEYRIA